MSISTDDLENFQQKFSTAALTFTQTATPALYSYSVPSLTRSTLGTGAPVAIAFVRGQDRIELPDLWDAVPLLVLSGPVFGAPADSV